MNSQEKELVLQIKDLFYQSRLNECIAIAEKLDQNRSFKCHQIISYYKGLSYFEIQSLKEGHECFQSIIAENSQLNGPNVDEIDVVIRAMYQLETYYTNVQKAESMNQHLLKVIEDYQEQHQNMPHSYQKAIYLFGKGMYLFVENSREQKMPECTKLIEEAVVMNSDYKQEMLISLGWMHYIYSKVDQSCKYHQQLYQINPRYPSLANNYAISIHEKGKNGKAEELFLEEEKLRGNNQIALQNIAQFYFSIENIFKEREYYEKLFALNPKTPRILHKYGQYLMRIGQKEKGLSLLKEGLELDPEYCPILQDLSDIEYDKSNFQLAKQYIEKCVNLYPQDGYYMYRYAVCLEVLGDPQMAIEAYIKAINYKNYLPYKIYSNTKLALLYSIQQEHLKCLEELFNSCNYKKVQTYLLKGNILQISQILCQQTDISLADKMKLINHQRGDIVTRFQQFSDNIPDHKIKYLFQYRLDGLRAALVIISYRKYIEQYLTFQSQIIHWDLFLD